MKYSVYQHWDPLKVCMVGKSYAPEFYSFITNSRVRNVMERIAQETEEDYQKLIRLLKSFNVEILRPQVPVNYEDCLVLDKIIPPPMTPRDYSAVIGNDLYFMNHLYEDIKGSDWPNTIPKTKKEIIDSTLPDSIKKEILTEVNSTRTNHNGFYSNCLENLKDKFNLIDTVNNVSAAMTTRIGKDLYFGTEYYNANLEELKKRNTKLFPNYRCHIINTGGHSDGTFCPVVPGLIVSLRDIPTYKTTFPDWEVIYLPGQSWNQISSFMDLKRKNKGKWWVPGEELNDDFTSFVESWLNHWVGFVEETVFDVNMLVIDEKNVVCNNYNETVFAAFDRYGITPHVVNFRHRYFWDGGLHCITSDLHREGTMKDYFPERG